jgi:hypothetical protein
MRGERIWGATLLVAAACGYPQPARVTDAPADDARRTDTNVANEDASHDASFDAPPPFSRLMLYGASLGNDTTQRDAYLASRFTVTTKADSTPISATLLATTDIVVVEHLYSAHTVSESNALATWVSNGGAVIVSSGWVPGETDLPRYNALFAGIGLQLSSPKVSGPITQFFTHPISTNMTSLPYVDGYSLTLPASGATEVGRLSGLPALAAIVRGQGRVVAYGDDFFNVAAEWKNDVPAFWAQMIDWLVGL